MLTVLRVATLAVALLAAQHAHAQEPVLAADDFGGSEIEGWRRLDRPGTWPSSLGDARVGSGLLLLRPAISPGSKALQELPGLFLYRDIEGDFEVTARVRIGGATGAIAEGENLQVGVLGRLPRATSAADWNLDREVWRSTSAGFLKFASGSLVEAALVSARGEVRQPHVDAIPRRSGWIELRLVRQGDRFTSAMRQEGETEWTPMRTLASASGPAMQVGVFAQGSRGGSSENPQTSLSSTAIEVDWVRIARPAP